MAAQAGNEIIITSMYDAATFWYISKLDLEFDSVFNGEVRANNGPNPTEYKPNIGEIVAVLIPSVHKWVRAEVQSMVVNCPYNTYSAFCLDYGITVKNIMERAIRQLPDTRLCRETPPVAKRIQLHGIMPLVLEGQYANQPSAYAALFNHEWDNSTYPFVANKLKSATSFFLESMEDKLPETRGIGYGDVHLMINGRRESLTAALCKEGYGEVNVEEFPILLRILELQQDINGHLLSGPPRLQELKFQMAIKKLVNFKMHSESGIQKLPTLASSPALADNACAVVCKEKEGMLHTKGSEVAAPAKVEPAEAVLAKAERAKVEPQPPLCKLERMRLQHLLFIAEERKRYVEKGKQILINDLSSGVHEVLFDAAENPGEVYIRLVKYDVKLKTLEAKIDAYAREKDKSARTMWRLSQWKVGLYCIAKYKDSHWFRAKITSMDDPDEVTCFYVDHGDSSKLPLKTDVLEIEGDQIYDLYFQAIRCRLAGIQPMSGEADWRYPAADAIYDLSVDSADVTRELYAKVCSVDEGSNLKPAILLGFHVSGLETVSFINRILIEMNLVQANLDEAHFLNVASIIDDRK